MLLVQKKTLPGDAGNMHGTLSRQLEGPHGNMGTPLQLEQAHRSVRFYQMEGPLCALAVLVPLPYFAAEKYELLQRGSKKPLPTRNKSCAPLLVTFLLRVRLLPVRLEWREAASALQIRTNTSIFGGVVPTFQWEQQRQMDKKTTFAFPGL